MFNQNQQKRLKAGNQPSQTNITNFFTRKTAPVKNGASQPNFIENTKPHTPRPSVPNNSLAQPVSGYNPFNLVADSNNTNKAVNYDTSLNTKSTFGGPNFTSHKAPQRLFSVLPSSQNRSTTKTQNQNNIRSSHSSFASRAPAKTSRSGALGGGSGIYVVPRKPARPKPESFSVSKVQAQFKNSQTTTQKRSAPWGKFSSDTKLQEKRYPQPFKSSSKYKQKNTQTITKDQLSACQLKVVDAIFSRKSNVFFTGSAGTGKSFLLQYIINEFHNKILLNERQTNGFLPTGSGDSSNSIAITASTGIAAFHIGGCTLHSFAGVGLGQGTVGQLVNKINKVKKNRDKWLALKYLIIDEVSMLDGDFFDKLEEIARVVRQINSPFGGIQLIVTGDFFQLPPVSRGDPKFCFDSNSWKKCITETIVLDYIYRQKDHEFASILNEARVGKLSAKAIQIFQSLSREVCYPNDGVQATELYSTRSEVDGSNFRRLSTLPGEITRFEAKDSGSDEYAVKSLDSNTLFPKTLEVKINAQVMLLKNMNHIHPGLVNGSLGIVIDFQSEVIDEGFDDKVSIQENEVDNFQSTLLFAARKKYSEQKYPFVRFTCGAELLITPEESTIEKNSIVVATRKQIPLILAWALSIHKSQGQTIERVKVDLSKVFEKGNYQSALDIIQIHVVPYPNVYLGQAYVALSRATSLQGLQVLSFNAQKVLAHPKVTEYYKSLMSES